MSCMPDKSAILVQVYGHPLLHNEQLTHQPPKPLSEMLPTLALRLAMTAGLSL